MIDKNEIDVTDWIPRKDRYDIFETVEMMITAHAFHRSIWFPKSYFRKYKTELAQLIKSNRNDYEIKFVYKKKNKESK